MLTSDLQENKWSLAQPESDSRPVSVLLTCWFRMFLSHIGVKAPVLPEPEPDKTSLSSQITSLEFCLDEKHHTVLSAQLFVIDSGKIKLIDIVFGNMEEKESESVNWENWSNWVNWSEVQRKRSGTCSENQAVAVCTCMFVCTCVQG